MTRVTRSMISRTLLADLHDVADRLARTQRKMSSGKELERPSDNPYGVSRALQLRDELGQTGQFRRNVAEVMNGRRRLAETGHQPGVRHGVREPLFSEVELGEAETAEPQAPVVSKVA